VINTSNGSIVQQLEYDEFGNILSEFVDSNFLRLPFGFAGGVYDPATGLLRFGARDYDPATGRWTAKDPVTFAGDDAILYAYVGSDPVNGIDPFGFENLTDLQFTQRLQTIVENPGTFNITRKVENEAICFAVEEVLDQSIDYGLYIVMDAALG